MNYLIHLLGPDFYFRARSDCCFIDPFFDVSGQILVMESDFHSCITFCSEEIRIPAIAFKFCKKWSAAYSYEAKKLSTVVVTPFAFFSDFFIFEMQNLKNLFAFAPPLSQFLLLRRFLLKSSPKSKAH